MVLMTVFKIKNQAKTIIETIVVIKICVPSDFAKKFRNLTLFLTIFISQKKLFVM